MDCGGACGSCSDKKTCSVAKDCASNVCTAKVCVKSSCSDEVKNGGETDVDCGGTCVDCNVGDSCLTNSDCSSSLCTANVCSQSATSCNNDKKDVGETDVDCGGTCVSSSNFKCSSGKKCLEDADCNTGLSCVDSVCEGGDNLGGNPSQNGSNAGGSSDDSAVSGSGGFPLGIVLPIVFLIFLIGVVLGIRKYKKAQRDFAPSQSFSQPFSDSSAPFSRSKRAPLPKRPSKYRSSQPRPTPSVMNKIREIPYLSGEKVFSELKQEIVKDTARPKRKRKL